VSLAAKGETFAVLSRPGVTLQSKNSRHRLHPCTEKESLPRAELRNWEHSQVPDIVAILRRRWPLVECRFGEEGPPKVAV
jgi:hypothetical protein